ncbi:MAG: hypothetical protein K0Q78_2117, partial [Cellvibrio sp.]|nr:hypothetical protein [Cellvibrio sp.]
MKVDRITFTRIKSATRTLFFSSIASCVLTSVAQAATVDLLVLYDNYSKNYF